MIVDRFFDPPVELKPQPLWFWNLCNKPMTKERVKEQVIQAKESGYFGLAPLATAGIYDQPILMDFLSDEFFEIYITALEQAKELGMEMLLYDENWFPSGSAGQKFHTVYPEHVVKVLIKTEIEKSGASENVELGIPSANIFLGAVIMDKDDPSDRRDVSSYFAGTTLQCPVPDGNWKIMIFSVRTTTNPNNSHKLANYLDKDAVEKYIEMTYERFYERLSPYFGSTIKISFFDEPGPFYFTKQWGEADDAEDFAIWHPRFNELFIEKYGRNPITMYPAVYYDIGEETPQARYELFKMRAELYAEGWFKSCADWCHDHGIKITGHILSDGDSYFPVRDGDPFWDAKYLDIPMIDDIYYNQSDPDHGWGFYDLGQCHRKAYKLWSSTAYNYDKPLVGTEVFGASLDLTPDDLFRLSMEQYSNGINFTVPHAVWYNNNDTIMLQALQYDDPVFGPMLPEYTTFMGRLNLLLQGGRHVADIAILFPQDTHLATAKFGERPGLKSDSNYQEIGTWLSDDKRIDYTIVHPEILDERIEVREDTLFLNNKVNFEQYKLLIIPKMEYIGLENLKKIKQFYMQGGKVIGISDLPERSMYLNDSSEVKEIIDFIFPPVSSKIPKVNDAGGKAYRIEPDDYDALSNAIDDACPVYDVIFTMQPKLEDRFFRYIHKIKDDLNIYFFINSSRKESDIVDLNVLFNGEYKTMKRLNPRTGDIIDIETEVTTQNGCMMTKVPLLLKNNECVFFVA